MKVVILAGGFGTRISEESDNKPKPMIEIGGKPILWHIMKHYSHYGYNDFIICAGYKADVIKEYFYHYYIYNTDTTFDLAQNKVSPLVSKAEPWKVMVVDTGLNTMTGGRIRRVQEYIGSHPFMLTYGDGVSSVDLHQLVGSHIGEQKYVTMTAVQPAGRFGEIHFDGNTVKGFSEKTDNYDSWVNGGFFLCEPDVFEYIKDDSTVWEKEPLETLTKQGKVGAYKHNGFWKPMDTLRDKMELEKMWETGNAPWKVWE